MGGGGGRWIWAVDLGGGFGRSVFYFGRRVDALLRLTHPTLMVFLGIAGGDWGIMGGGFGDLGGWIIGGFGLRGDGMRLRW